MMLQVEIAIRYLFTKKKEAFVSVINIFSLIGITLGVATLIIVMSVINGYEKELIRNIMGIKSHIVIHYTDVNENSAEGNLSLKELMSLDHSNTSQNLNEQYGLNDFISKIKKLPNVKSVNRVVQGYGIITSQYNTSGVLIEGIDLQDLRNKSSLKYTALMSNDEGEGGVKICEDINKCHKECNDYAKNGCHGGKGPGEGIESQKGEGARKESDTYAGSERAVVSYKNAVTLGMELAKNLNVGLGDRVKVMTSDSYDTVIGQIPKAKTLKVVGIFDAGIYDYNSSIVFIQPGVAKALMKNNSNNYIEVSLKDYSLDEEAIIAIRSVINTVQNGKKIYDGYNFYPVSWKKSHTGLVQALAVEKSVMSIIVSLIILIATFNIISSLVILVKDKEQSIAVLKTLGMSRFKIMQIFILCGSSIGIVGTILGTILGVFFTINIQSIKSVLENSLNVTIFDPTVYFLTNLPYEISIQQIVYIAIFSIFAAFLATIYPSLKIASTSPTRTLK